MCSVRYISYTTNNVVIPSTATLKGVEVLHLFQGRPLCSLPLAPMHTSHADIDADGTIEHMSAILTHPEGMCVHVIIYVVIVVCVPQKNSHLFNMGAYRVLMMASVFPPVSLSTN